MFLNIKYNVCKTQHITLINNLNNLSHLFNILLCCDSFLKREKREGGRERAEKGEEEGRFNSVTYFKDL